MSFDEMTDKVLKTAFGALVIGVMAGLGVVLIALTAKIGPWMGVVAIMVVPCYLIGNFIVEDWK